MKFKYIKLIHSYSMANKIEISLLVIYRHLKNRNQSFSIHIRIFRCS